MWEIVGAIWHVAGWLSFGIALTIGAAVVGWVFPSLRQVAAGAAAALAFGTVLYGKGVYDERQVCAARDARALEQAEKRDDKQGEHAARDEVAAEAELAELRRQLKEANDAYAGLLADRKSGNCALTPDDFPRRR